MKKSVIDPSQNVLVDAYGRLDSSVVTGAGRKYGLDLYQYRLCDQVGLMFRNGDLMWAEMRQFTIDVVFDVTGWTDPATAEVGWGFVVGRTRESRFRGNPGSSRSNDRTIFIE